MPQPENVFQPIQYRTYTCKISKNDSDEGDFDPGNKTFVVRAASISEVEAKVKPLLEGGYFILRVEYQPKMKFIE